MKKRGTRSEVWRFALPVLAGVLVFTTASLLGAYALKSDLLPMEAAGLVAVSSLAIGAITAGAMTGGEGKRALITGCGLLFLYLILRLVISAETFLSIRTVIGMAICIICPGLGSCIFHKKPRHNTKRNRSRAARK